MWPMARSTAQRRDLRTRCRNRVRTPPPVAAPGRQASRLAGISGDQDRRYSSLRTQFRWRASADSGHRFRQRIRLTDVELARCVCTDVDAGGASRVCRLQAHASTGPECALFTMAVFQSANRLRDRIAGTRTRVGSGRHVIGERSERISTRRAHRPRITDGHDAAGPGCRARAGDLPSRCRCRRCSAR